MAIPSIEGRRFSVGKYDIVAKPIPQSAHMLRYTVFVGGKRIGSMKVHDTENADEYESEHPAVRTHPDTGRKALYVSRSHTIRFKDMSEEESRSLIDFLQAHQTRPEFTCRVRWAPGTLTIWDNRCTQHCAVNDYHGQRRRMRRLTVGGQTPR